MPLLMNVLQNANAPEYKKLRVKAMECAGLIGIALNILKFKPLTEQFYIAIAVGRDIFRPDASNFVQLLMRIQSKYYLPDSGPRTEVKVVK